MPTPGSLVVFILASFSGIFVAFLTLQSTTLDRSSLVHRTPVSNLPAKSYDKWLHESGFERSTRADGSFRESEARFLFMKVPVVCVIYVQSRQQVRSVSSTWTRHCNHVAYFGNFKDEYVPIHQIPGTATGPDVACDVLRFVCKRFAGRFKWILLADDQTYAIVENLRSYVAPLNASGIYYLGHPMQDSDGFYNMLNAGIVLSEGSVMLLRRLMGKSCSKLEKTTMPLDRFLGILLRKGDGTVRAIDTRDVRNRGRFNPFSVEDMLIPGSISYFNSYWRSSLFLSPEGRGCCSTRAVTFHRVNPVEMFLLEYLVYHLRIGNTGGEHAAPTGVPPQEIPLDLRSLMNGKAFVKPFGISQVDEFRIA